jgi:hypothetical protein
LRRGALISQIADSARRSCPSFSSIQSTTTLRRSLISG